MNYRVISDKKLFELIRSLCKDRSAYYCNRKKKNICFDLKYCPEIKRYKKYADRALEILKEVKQEAYDNNILTERLYNKIEKYLMELKPCPFCGMILRHDDTQIAKDCYKHPFNSKCILSFRIILFNEHKAWNTRQAPELDEIKKESYYTAMNESWKAGFKACYNIIKSYLKGRDGN